MKKKNIQTISKILILVFFVSIWGTFSACSASKAPMDNGYKSDLAVESDSVSGMFSDSAYISQKNPNLVDKTSTETQADKENIQTEDYLSSQKLIYTCSIEIETLEFADTQNKIQELIQQNGGFVESNRLYDDAYGWYYSSYEKTTGTLRQELKIRVPSENYDAFINGVSLVGKVQHKTENVQNITTQYNDTATTITSLKTQEARLLEMMAACDNVDDMITVERRLSEVQMQLERYQTQLNGYDADIKFSTVNISLEEVREYSPTYEEKSFFQRFKEHCLTTIEDFATFIEWALFAIVYLSPYVLIIALLVITVRKIFKSRKTKRLASVDAVTIQLQTDEALPKQQKDDSVQTQVGKQNKTKKS